MIRQWPPVQTKQNTLQFYEGSASLNFVFVDVERHWLRQQSGGVNQGLVK